MDTSVHEWLKKKKKEREKESGSEKRRKKKFSAPLNELGTGRIYFFPQLAPPFTFYLRGILRENSARIHCRTREEGHAKNDEENRRIALYFYYLTMELLGAGFTSQSLVLNWQLRNRRKGRWRYY